MEEELISMGIASPVTKETAGRSYHKELSRQVTILCLSGQLISSAPCFLSHQ